MAGSRPRIILSGAVSIDGRIASTMGDSRLSSEQDIARLHRLRGRVDAILVGINTVISDDPLLTVRHAGRKKPGRPPARIILDSRGRIPSSSRIIKTSGEIPTIIAVSEKAPPGSLRRLRRSPAELMVAGGDLVDIRMLLERISGRGINTVLVEGGGTVNWEFVREDLFDEVVVTVSPFLLGGREAVPLVGGAGFPGVSDSPKLRLRSARRMQDHVVLSYVRA